MCKTRTDISYLRARDIVWAMAPAILPLDVVVELAKNEEEYKAIMDVREQLIWDMHDIVRHLKTFSEEGIPKDVEIQYFAQNAIEKAEQFVEKLKEKQENMSKCEHDTNNS